MKPRRVRARNGLAAGRAILWPATTCRNRPLAVRKRDAPFLAIDTDSPCAEHEIDSLVAKNFSSRRIRLSSRPAPAGSPLTAAGADGARMIHRQAAGSARHSRPLRAPSAAWTPACRAPMTTRSAHNCFSGMWTTRVSIPAGTNSWRASRLVARRSAATAAEHRRLPARSVAGSRGVGRRRHKHDRWRSRGSRRTRLRCPGCCCRIAVSITLLPAAISSARSVPFGSTNRTRGASISPRLFDHRTLCSL